MSPATPLFDFGHESTLDVTGETFISMATLVDEPGFKPSVPDHLSEAVTALWDQEPLW